MTGAALSGVAAILALWSGLMRVGPVPVLTVVLVAASVAAAAGLMLLRPCRRAVAFHGAAALSAACVTSAVATSAAGAAAAHVFYVPVVLYVGYFLTRGATIAFTAACALGFAAVTAAQGLDAAGPRATFLAITLVVTATLLRLLRDRVFALIVALDRAARNDALTGALNRLGLDEQLHEELERASRGGHDCAVLMGDLDHFKILNDRVGHHAGDLALRRIATILRDRLRKLDTVARYGGDEFVVVLPGTGREAAQQVVAELEDAVAASSFEHRCAVAISFGVAVFPYDGLTPDEVLHAADTHLLATKGARRGIVVGSRE